jgi:hypothetical protein
MGVDTRACCMIGMEFESMEAALAHLECRGHIASAEYDEYLNEGEIQLDSGIEWQIFSCYENGGGVLGYHVSNAKFATLQDKMNEVEALLGGDVQLHNFVYWY